MKVLLLKDVYKLGRAGDVKKVADGYGRNYLIPQGMAVLATQQAIKSSHFIREQANVQREQLNKEMDAVAKRLMGVTLTFPARASETGKLYGSITTQMIAEALTRKTGIEVSKRQVESQPLRNLGEHEAAIHLTVDLIPKIKIIIHREGEAVTLPSEVELEEIEAEVSEIAEMAQPDMPAEAELPEVAEQLEELEEAE